MICPNNPKPSLNFLIELFQLKAPWIFHYFTKIMHKKNIDSKQKKFILNSILKVVKSSSKINL